jgi:hypothetical protein
MYFKFKLYLVKRNHSLCGLMTLQFYTIALVRGAKVMQTYEVEYEDNECSVPCHAFFSADVLFSMLTFSTFHGTSRPRVVYLVTQVLHIAHCTFFVRLHISSLVALNVQYVERYSMWREFGNNPLRATGGCDNRLWETLCIISN